MKLKVCGLSNPIEIETCVSLMFETLYTCLKMLLICCHYNPTCRPKMMLKMSVETQIEYRRFVQEISHTIWGEEVF